MKTRPCGPAHVLDLRKAVIADEHLHAANEPEAAPARTMNRRERRAARREAEQRKWIEADLADNRDKARRRARRNDAAALDLQLNQRAFADVLRFAEGLPPLAED